MGEAGFYRSNALPISTVVVTVVVVVVVVVIIIIRKDILPVHRVATAVQVLLLLLLPLLLEPTAPLHETSVTN